jgi:hypothetical protein
MAVISIASQVKPDASPQAFQREHDRWESSSGQDFIGVCMQKWLSVPGALSISQSYFNHGHDVVGVGGDPPYERNPVGIPQSH